MTSNTGLTRLLHDLRALDPASLAVNEGWEDDTGRRCPIAILLLTTFPLLSSSLLRDHRNTDELYDIAASYLSEHYRIDSSWIFDLIALYDGATEAYPFSDGPAIASIGLEAMIQSLEERIYDTRYVATHIR